MDLLRSLWKNSRISFNQLGKDLEISGNILKKRAEKLEEEGVFIYHTNPVFSQFRFGLCAFTADIPKQFRNHYIEKISSIEEVYEIIFSLEEKCAIIALLPFSESTGVAQETIDKFYEEFNEEIPDIELKECFKLYFLYSERPISLKPMELKLLRLLRQDSRKDLINLSEQMGLSKKTLSRYLTKFSNQNLIRHTIGLQPSKIRNFVIHFLIIKFENGNNLRKKIDNLKARIKNYLSYFIMIDPPGLALYVYSETLSEMEELMTELYMHASIKEIEVFFPSSIVRFEEWKDLVIPLKEK